MPHKGYKTTREHRQKLSESHKGKTPSKETKEKMSKSHKGKNTWSQGRKLSVEHKLKLSKALKGKKHKLGKKLSVEHRQKLSDNKKGAKHWNWQGGITKKYIATRQKKYQLQKRENGGSHTLSQWEELKMQYGYMCLCCKRTEPEIRLTADHIIPVVKGGSNNIENIQPLCRSCNSKKYTQIINYLETNLCHQIFI